MVDARSFREAALRRLAGRRWLIAVDVAQAATALVDLVAAAGAPRPFVIAGASGTGPGPDPSRADVAVLDLPPAADMMTGIRAFEAAHGALPADVAARVDAWDPTGEARVLGTIFAVGTPLAGRRYYGARPAAWQALEDKTVCDAIWDAAGVARAPSRVVPARADALADAHRALDRGDGTVWSGDMREGFHGGATMVRHVRSATHQTEFAAFFAARCDRVRVMPFLEGVPCSIHGIVFPDGVAALRPMEMVVLRAAGTGRFVYARAASFWEPTAADGEAMRDVARRVGAWLRARHGYAGVFTVDGVMTTDGFRPTELNPRYGAALGVLTGPLELATPLVVLHFALVEGEPTGVDPPALERCILDASATVRGGACGITVPKRVSEEVRYGLFPDGDGWRLGPDPTGADAKIVLGPSRAGGFLSIVPDATKVPIGPPLAPRVARWLTWLDAELGLGVGPVAAARVVR